MLLAKRHRTVFTMLVLCVDFPTNPQAWEQNQFQPSEKNQAPPRNNVITWQGPSLPEEADAGGLRLTVIGTHHRGRGCPFGTEGDYDRGIPLESGSSLVHLAAPSCCHCVSPH